VARNSGTLTVPIIGVDLPRALFWIGLVYVLFASVIAFWIGKPIIWLSFNNEKFNAAFRYALVRLRDAAEAVAFYRGEVAERSGLRAALRAAIERGASGIISFGIAGGLAPHLAAGDWVVASGVASGEDVIATDRAWTQRLLDWLLIVMRTVVAAGDETRPLKSKVIVAGAQVIVTDCAAGLRVLSDSGTPPLTETTDQPCAQPATAGEIVTLALRLSASLRASMRSPVRSYDMPLACCAARNSLMDGAAMPRMMTRIDTTVSSSTIVKPRAWARGGRGEAIRIGMAHQQVLRAAVLAPVWSIASVPQRSLTWSLAALGVAVMRKVGGGPATVATARSYAAATLAGVATPTVARLGA